MAGQSTRRFKDETGNKYGKLAVLRFEGMRKGQPFFICLCQCGRQVSVRGANLRSGNTTSCGCSRRKTMPKKRGRIQMQTVCGVHVGESETPRLRENRLLHELHTVPPHRLLHGAKTA